MPESRLPSASLSSNPDADRIQGRVDAAAFALLREGRNPTVASIRARIGGARPNAVAPALRRWRLSFAAQLDTNAGSALEVLPPGVLELVQALSSRALFEAHRVRDDGPDGVDRVEGLDEILREVRVLAARLQAREEALDGKIRAVDAQCLRVKVLEIAMASKPRKSTPSRLAKPRARRVSRSARASMPVRRRSAYRGR